jgi:cysteine desulfurase
MELKDFAYLDHNATTTVRPEAAAAVAQSLSLTGNPSSVHHAGRAARRQLAEAREAVARAIGMPPDGLLVFTSGGTEANQLAIGGGTWRVLRSAIEHDSVRAADARAAAIPVDAGGTVVLEALSRQLAESREPTLVSVMAANNETGVIQPIGEIVRIAHAAGARVHCDAIQAIGKIPFRMDGGGADLVSVSAHKLGGPQGVGALAVAPGVALSARQTGGGQESGLRAGTENLPGIAGFAVAVARSVAELDGFAALASLRDAMERRLAEAEPEAVFFGQGRPRLPNTSCVALPGVPSATQVMALDLAGVGVSAGAACSSGKVRPSHVLQAMGHGEALASSAIRISLGRDTSEADIDRLVAAWTALARRTAGTRRAA